MDPFILFMLALALWWALGVAMVLWEMSWDMDVTIGWVLMAVIMGIGGPVWILRTVSRKTSNIVLIKKREVQDGR